MGFVCESLLRRKYFHHGMPFLEKTVSTVANELHQLRDQHPVTGLREGFIFSLENTLHHQAHHNMAVSQEGTANSSFLRNVGSVFIQMPEAQRMDIECNTNTQNDFQNQPMDQDTHGLEESAASGRMDWEQNADDPTLNAEDEDENYQKNAENGLLHEIQNTIEDDENNLELQASFPQESDMVLERQQDEYDISRCEQSDLASSINTSSLYYHNVNVELRQLLNRRCVTNMSSDFHDSLDRLVQSFILRQKRNETNGIAWNLRKNIRDRDSFDKNHCHPRDHVIIAPEFSDAYIRSAPSTPLPQSIRHQNDYGNLPQLNVHQPQIEREIVNDLKADVSKLQDGMTQIQRMLDACLNMQEELQRFLQLEVSVALKRYIGGKGPETDFSGGGSIHTRKGTCCICCDNPIDSLLYRCGHMCTCYQCGSELFRTEGKCPLCRAPLVEVIRAYSML